MSDSDFVFNDCIFKDLERRFNGVAETFARRCENICMGNK